MEYFVFWMSLTYFISMLCFVSAWCSISRRQSERHFTIKSNSGPDGRAFSPNYALTLLARFCAQTFGYSLRCVSFSGLYQCDNRFFIFYSKIAKSKSWIVFEKSTRELINEVELGFDTATIFTSDQHIIFSCSTLVSVETLANFWSLFKSKSPRNSLHVQHFCGAMGLRKNGPHIINYNHLFWWSAWLNYSDCQAVSSGIETRKMWKVLTLSRSLHIDVLFMTLETRKRGLSFFSH